VATIETEGVLGNQYLAISFGSPGQADVHDGETIQSRPPLEVADLLNKTSKILDGSQLAIENATMATEHLNSISAKIDAGQGTVGSLINDKQLYTNLDQSTASLHDTMLQAQAGATDFRENMEALKHNFLLSGYFKKRGYQDSSSLTANGIDKLPAAAPLKVFTYNDGQLFDGHDSAKLKNQKSLRDIGDFLAENQFGFAVVVVSAGAEGDTQKDLVLSQARAMVLRDYLVNNFAFDDSLLKTLGLGKQTKQSAEGEPASIRILIYPKGTDVPADASATADSASSTK